jgi:hypothetical protein
MSGGAAAAYPSVTRFLSRAGTHSRGTEVLLFLVLLYGAVEWVLADRSETALYVILFAVPFAAGTGLLAIARLGQLDLLLGAGVTREAIWRNALLRAVGVPLLACIVAAAMFHGRQPFAEVIARAIAITLFTGGVAFATGLLNPRFAAGVAWIAARLILIMSGVGVKVLAQLKMARGGEAYPPPQELLLASLAFPELLLDPGAPLIYLLGVATVGVVAIVVSRAVFVRAELSGRRSA